jgi:hypothetical protein
MKTQIDNIHFLNISNDAKLEPISADSLGISEKAQLFLRKTLEAGQREDRLAHLQRIKKLLWDYNLGTAKGWIKGMGQALKDFFDPHSDFHNPDYQEIFKDIQQLPDTALDQGIAFMDADWKGRGELNAERAIQGGMWLLKIYFGSKDLGKGILSGAKKLFLETP